MDAKEGGERLLDVGCCNVGCWMLETCSLNLEEDCYLGTLSAILSTFISSLNILNSLNYTFILQYYFNKFCCFILLLFIVSLFLSLIL
jgi:hypothetical protein